MNTSQNPDEQRKLTPTERVFELGMAIAAKQPQQVTETRRVYQPATGDGKWRGEAIIPRGEDETADQYSARWRRAFAELDEEVMYRNRDDLRAKLAASVAQARGEKS